MTAHSDEKCSEIQPTCQLQSSMNTERFYTHTSAKKVPRYDEDMTEWNGMIN